MSAISDSLNFTFGKALAQINLGLLLLNSGSYDASNNAFFKAIDYAEACGGLRLKAVSLNNIADNFLSLRNYEKCKEYAQKAINFNTEIITNKNDSAELQLNPYRGIAINYELLFRCYFSQKRYNDARNSLEKGVPFALKANDSYIFSPYYLAFGKLKAIGNDFDSAKYYFRKAVTEAKIQTDLRNEFQAYLGEAQFLTNLPFKTKLMLLDSALSYCY